MQLSEPKSSQESLDIVYSTSTVPLVASLNSVRENPGGSSVKTAITAVIVSFHETRFNRLFFAALNRSTSSRRDDKFYVCERHAVTKSSTRTLQNSIIFMLLCTEFISTACNLFTDVTFEICLTIRIRTETNGGVTSGTLAVSRLEQMLPFVSGIINIYLSRGLSTFFHTSPRSSTELAT
jgi:hypothetical protein